MAEQLSIVNTSTDNFGGFVTKFNTLVNLVNTNVLTANSSAGITTGNAFVVGILGANTLVCTTLQGGNVTTSGGINVVSNGTITVPAANVTFGNSTVYSLVNPTSIRVVNSTSSVNVSPIGITVGNSVVNTLSVAVGANLVLNTTSVYVGNSTANAVLTRTSLVLANSTSNTVLQIPNTIQYAATNYFLHANGSWVTVNPGTTSPGSSNTYVQFNDSDTFGGSAGLTFNKTTNNMVLGNTMTIGGSLLVGSNAIMNLTHLRIGNSSVNFTTNSSAASITGTFSASGNLAVNTSVLVVDATNGRVGINNTAPGAALAVNGDITTTASLTVGSNVTMNVTHLRIGNSTVFVTANSSALSTNGSISSRTLSVIANASLGSVLTVDATNSRVGINNSTPSHALAVNGVIYGPNTTHAVS